MNQTMLNQSIDIKYTIIENLYLPLWVNILITIISISNLIYLIYIIWKILKLRLMKIQITREMTVTVMEIAIKFLTAELIVSFVINVVCLILSGLSYKNKYDINTYWKNKKINAYIPDFWNSCTTILLLITLQIFIFLTSLIIQNYKTFINTTTSNKIKAYLNKIKKSIFNIICLIAYLIFAIIIIPLFILLAIYLLISEYNDYKLMTIMYSTNTYISLVLDIINISIQIMCLFYLLQIMTVFCIHYIKNLNRKRNTNTDVSDALLTNNNIIF